MTKPEPKQKLLGLFELDENGNVLYSSVESASGSMYREPTFDGSNFFTEVAGFTNSRDFQRRFELFRLGETQAHSFDFTCEYADGPAPVKVLMARLFKDPPNRSFLVHLRKV